MAAPRMNHWLERIETELARQEDAVPSGFESCVDMQKRLGWGRWRVMQSITAGLQAGVIERVQLRRRVGDSLHTVPHYREVSASRRRQ